MERDKLQDYCFQGLSMRKIAVIEGLTQSAVRYWLKKHGLKTSPACYWNIEKLKKVVAESKTIHEAMVSFGLDSSASSYNSFKRNVSNHNIDTSHFLSVSETIKLSRKPTNRHFHAKDTYLKNEQKYKFVQYVRGATRRGFNFDLTERQFIMMWNEKCTYCGDKIEGIGIDRINSERDYTPDNVVPCCRKCNVFKTASDYIDFVEHCKKVYFYFEEERIKSWYGKLICGG